MTEVADLRIRVQSDGTARAAGELNSLTAAGGRAERATDSLMGTLGRFASAAAIAGAAVAGLGKLMSTQRQFDVINAGLVTATGSSERAAVAFETLQDFAANTPYSLQQVSDGFVKLVNLGLTPSERALTSYGETASAMGKDLSQMIEAVADASTGEFERLKEFGIRASKQGDQVRLTFKGVTETVANEAGAIEDYLIKLGETNFAGNMAQRMATLDGAMSNLGDEWDKLFLNISQGGVGDAIADAVRVGIDALAGLNDWLNSGELEGAIDSLGASFGPWAEDAGEAVDIVQTAMADFGDWLNSTYPQDMQVLSDAWSDFPENIRAIIQAAGMLVAAFVEDVRSAAQAVEDAWAAIGDGMGGKTLAEADAAWDARRKQTKANVQESIALILQERQATIDGAKAANAAAQERAAAANRERDARRAAGAGQDRLAGFGIDRPATSPDGDGGRAKADKAEARRREELERIAEQKARELQMVRDSLMTEEEAIQASYQRRRQIVLENMPAGEDQTRLLEKLQREKDFEVAFLEQAQREKHERLMQASMTEEELARASIQRQIEEQRLAYQQGIIDKEEFERNKRNIEEYYEKMRAAAATNERARQLEIWASMFGGLGQLSAQFAQGQSKSAERMFNITKALNIAQTVMSTQAAVMKAYADPTLMYPMNIVASVAAAAKGAASVAAIAQQKFSGAYDDGGRIPAGSFGVVGERGMEIVEGPANVTSRRETARMLRRDEDTGGGGAPIVTINVAVDARGNATSTTETSGTGDAENAKKLGSLIDERVRGLLIQEQRQGGLLSTNR